MNLTIVRLIFLLLLTAVSFPSATPIVAATPSRTPIPTKTLRPTRTPIPSRTPRPTRTPTNTRTPTLTRTATVTRTATITKTPTAPAFNEAKYVTAISDALEATGLDIRTIKVADGRKNGGVRSAIITYVTYGTQTSDFAREWGLLFRTVGLSIEDNDLDLDEVAIVVGLPNGKAAAMLVAQASDLHAFHLGEIDAIEFLNRVQVTTF